MYYKYLMSTETQRYPSLASADASSQKIHTERNPPFSLSLLPFWLLNSELQFLVQMKCQWKKLELFSEGSHISGPEFSAVLVELFLLTPVAKFVQKDENDFLHWQKDKNQTAFKKETVFTCGNREML